MKAHRILGGILAAVTITVLVLDITAPAVFAIVATIWLAFAVSVALVERQERRDHEQVARMAARAQHPTDCETGPRQPEFYRDSIPW